MSTGALDSVLASIDGSRDELVGFLQEFLGFRTESQSPEADHFLSEADACREFLAAFLAGLGFEMQQWEAQAVSFPRHPVLAGRLPGTGGGRSLALNGHFDVVPAGDPAAWTADPWGRDIAGGRLYGRGAVDMKGGIAAMLWALVSLRRCGIRLAGDAWVHLVSDEEVVGHGSRECVDRLPPVDTLIDPEPSNMAVTPVTGGLEHLRIEVSGESAHAGVRYRSLQPDGGHAGGVNAIEKMVKILVALQELERELTLTRSHPLLPTGFNTMLPGIIVGGPGGGEDGRLNMVTNPGTTPDYCALEYNIWYYPGEDLEQVKQEIAERIRSVGQDDDWLREHPPVLTWALRGISFPAAATPQDHPSVQAMLAALADVGVEQRVDGATYVTDLSWYQARGIPGFIFAPGSIDQAHAPNEYVDLDNLVAATKAFAAMLLRWCGEAGR